MLRREIITIRLFSSRARAAEPSETHDAPEGFLSDAALVNRCLSRDADAWAEFVDRFGALIRSRVADVAASSRRGHDWSMIDDITAEVFASLVANDAAALRAFAGRSRLSTYLAVIATRVATRVVSRLNQQPGTSEQITADATGERSTASRQADRLIDDEDRQQLLSLVDRLPPRQRELIELHYRQGQTYSQISQRIGIPLGSIGPTLRRAEAKLRVWIEGVEDK
ncbi:MAG: RNA polymerase sigma factor [Planctomycetota bacterium]